MHIRHEPKHYTAAHYVAAVVIGFAVTLYLLTRPAGAPATALAPASSALSITDDPVRNPEQYRGTPLPFKQKTADTSRPSTVQSNPANDLARNRYVLDLFDAILVAGVQWDKVRVAVGHVELGGAKKQEVLESLDEAIPAIAAADKLHKALTPTPDLITIHDLAGQYIGLTQRVLEFMRHHYTGRASGEALAVSTAQQMIATYQRMVSAMQAWRAEHPEQKNSLTDTIFANLGQK